MRKQKQTSQAVRKQKQKQKQKRGQEAGTGKVARVQNKSKNLSDNIASELLGYSEVVEQ